MPTSPTALPGFSRCPVHHALLVRLPCPMCAEEVRKEMPLGTLAKGSLRPERLQGPDGSEIETRRI